MAVFQQLHDGAVIQLAPPDQDVASVNPPQDKGRSWLGVCSSGSTGKPKTVWRPWDELVAGVNGRVDLEGWAWGTSFEPWSFAGVQVALQAWKTQGSILALDNDWERNWARIFENQVRAISCTPTFLDLLVQHEATHSPDCALTQITLGGEPLRPSVGKRIQRRFSQCRFTVIYASAELGVMLKTHRTDGWYEIESLQRRFPNWRQSESGALEIQNLQGWQSTGDLIEVQDRVLRIIGRCDDVANVAGVKVSLSKVAECAEEVPGIRRAVATATTNNVTGQIVCLRYELDTGADSQAVRKDLECHMRLHLPKAAWPRVWMEGNVGLGANSKRGAERVP
jgi:acyl-coenzyme A synthetase/AMP-(fatty) acid ligase